MEDKPTKRQRIITGILCIPFALVIDWFLIMSIYRIIVSGISSAQSAWGVLVLFVILGYLLNRSAYMLLRYPDGIENGYLIHPYMVFGLCIFALTASLVALGFVLLAPEVFENNRDYKGGRAIGALLVAIPALFYAVKTQYSKIFTRESDSC